MFRCSGCGLIVGPGIPPIIRVDSTRSAHYPYRRDAFGREMDDPGGDGKEIVSESKLCVECARKSGVVAAAPFVSTTKEAGGVDKKKKPRKRVNKRTQRFDNDGGFGSLEVGEAVKEGRLRAGLRSRANARRGRVSRDGDDS